MMKDDLLRMLPGTSGMLEDADTATGAAQGAFPGQDWDNSQYNAARHALWTALMAKRMGGGGIGQGVAKGVGYANELAGLLTGGNLTQPGAQDMRHDLNNNEVGLQTLRELQGQGKGEDQSALIQAILQKAAQAKTELPPNALAPAQPYLTRGQ